VGIHDDFLELGGDSMLATQIVMRVRQAMHSEVPLRTLLESPTVAKMALVITHAQASQADQQAMAQMLAAVEGLTDEQAQQLLSGASQLPPSQLR
jgi:surfactin family lipopeptide synthetase C